MPKIAPVSDLRNYTQVLNEVKKGSPVYLTVNGRGRYVVRDIDDDEDYENEKAMFRLMAELQKGFQSGDRNGWKTADEAREILRRKTNAVLHEQGNDEK